MPKVKITTASSKQTTSLPSSTQHPWFTQATPGWNPQTMSTPSFETRDTYPESSKEDANIEAEAGETALVPDKGGLPAHYKIGGKRHLKGGTPLNVTKDTFIFSDTKKMRIKEPEILAEFGKAKGSYTPAQIAKKYDINKFRRILQDPDSDDIMVSTAEKMISNYNLKLAKLALVQESKKGFPQGIPAVAMPYMMTNQVSPDSILPLKPSQGQPGQSMRYGGFPKAQYGQEIDPFEQAKSWNKMMNAGTENAIDPFDQANSWDKLAGQNKVLPGAIDLTVKNKRMIGEPEVAAFIGAEKLVTAGLGAREALKRDKEARKKTQAGYLFESADENRGDYTTIAGYYKPDENTIGYIANAPHTEYGGTLPQAQFGWNGRNTWRNYGWGQPGYAMPWGVPQQGYGYGPPQYTQIAQSSGTPYTTGSTSTTTKKRKVTSMTPPADAVIIDYDADKQTLDKIAIDNKINPDTGMSESGKPVYLKKADGSYEKVTPLIETYEAKDSRLGTKARDYEYLRSTLDANPKLVDKMYENYKTNVNKSTDLTPDKKAKLLAMDKTQVYNNFLQAQKHTFAILANKGPASLKSEASQWNTTKQGKNKKYADTMKELGFGDAERLSDDQIASFQAAYRGFQDVSDSNDPDAAILKKFQMYPEGTQTGTKHTYGSKGKYISSVDDLFGSATAGQAMKPIGPLTTTPFTGTETEEDVTTDNQRSGMPAQYTRGRQDAPFWLQDIVNSATAFGNRMSLKKYLPWAPKVLPRVPTATYYDPTRELAANAEQVKIQTEGAGLFAGPQAFGSRSSRIQGLGAKNAADVLAKYHNLNVGVANRFSALKADIYNKADQTNAAVATDLYNKTTIANQQFDNAKRQAGNEIAGTYVNALTNRAMTQTLNTMYPNFQVDPMSGGFLEFYKGNEMVDSNANSSNALAQMNKLKEDYPGWDEETYREAVGLGSKSKNRSQGEQDAWQAYQQQMAGYTG